MSLEDEIGDVVQKARVGVGIDKVSLCKKAGIGEADYERVIEGKGDEGAIRKLADALGLSGDALWGLKEYCPAVELPKGVRRLELPFHAWTVNAWLLEAGDTQILFDSGWRAGDAVSALGGVDVEKIFTTHAHEDHVGGDDDFRQGGVKIYSAEESLGEETFDLGGLQIRVVDLAGHASPAAGYVVAGLERQVFVVGDAIFAGSMGRCKGSAQFQKALRKLRESADVLSEDCLILPGHGPATTWASEKRGNPFLPIIKRG